MASWSSAGLLFEAGDVLLGREAFQVLRERELDARGRKPRRLGQSRARFDSKRIRSAGNSSCRLEGELDSGESRETGVRIHRSAITQPEASREPGPRVCEAFDKDKRSAAISLCVRP